MRTIRDLEDLTEKEQNFLNVERRKFQGDMHKAGSILSLKNTENKISENKTNEKENKINESL